MIAVEPLIRSRMIVAKSQIGKDFRYAFLPSASGLDYNAKLAVIRTSLPKGNREAALLSLELPSETLIVQPVEILKGDNGSSVLKAKVMPDCIDRSIPVSSVYKVTVLRWTLK